jgi:hypothetical protein
VGAERWDKQVGSVADEAGRLLESLRRSAAEAAAHPPEGDDPRETTTPDAGVPAGGSPGLGAGDGPDAGAHDPFCQWCPLCRGAAVVRSLSPETLARLADLASLAATVLADLASRPGAQPAAAPGPDAEPAGTASGGPSAPGTPAARPRRTTPAPSRPIPVSDADDPQEAPRG